MQIQGRVALVTGGGSGLGEGVVRMMAANGGSAVIFDLATSAGALIAEELGARVRFFAVDVTEPAQVEAGVAAAVQAFGRIDVCINCAGMSPAGRTVTKTGTLFPLEVFRRTVDVNLNGLFDVVRHAAGAMSKNTPSSEGERGLIVNVASIAGIEGQIGQAAYAASKAGVIGLTLPLARDLAMFGIRVMTVCPGIMDTAMLAGIEQRRRNALIDIHVFPKRLGVPSDFAHLVRAFMENTLLNGEVVRLDAATRLS